MKRSLRATVTCILASFVLVPAARSAGPEQVASVDRSLWPERVDSPAGFDAASFAENVFFARALLDGVQAFEGGALDLGAKATHKDSVALWRNRTVARVLQNLRLALGGCATQRPCAAEEPPTAETLGPRVRAAAERLTTAYPTWAVAADAFYRVYAREQLRLAALFPSPTSEILPLADGEVLGDRLPDRAFLLTFDDGPTPKGGDTDRLMAWLREQGLSATFFVLDDALKARQAASESGALRALYAGQCVGSHGREHKPHPALVTWRESIDVTRADVQAMASVSGAKVPFRPPYGQRSQAMLKRLAELGDPVVLWNVDSQDWNAKIPAESVGDRVFTLMLLWRSGIVLFHDVHPRALRALPGITQSARAAGLTFRGCAEP